MGLDPEAISHYLHRLYCSFVRIRYFIPSDSETHTSKSDKTLEPPDSAAFDEEVCMTYERDGEQRSCECTEGQRGHIVVDTDVRFSIRQGSRFGVERPFIVVE